MAELSMQTKIDQIELKADPITGEIAFVILQNINLFLADGIVVSSQTERNSMAAMDPNVAAVLGDALTSAMVTIQTLRVQLATAQASLQAAASK